MIMSNPFFIEYEEGRFIDAKRINYLSTTNGVIKFTLTYEPRLGFTVAKSQEKTFLNHLQSINDNIVNLEGLVKHTTIESE